MQISLEIVLTVDKNEVQSPVMNSKCSVMVVVRCHAGTHK